MQTFQNLKQIYRGSAERYIRICVSLAGIIHRPLYPIILTYSKALCALLKRSTHAFCRNQQQICGKCRYFCSASMLQTWTDTPIWTNPLKKKEITKTSTHSATWARVLAYYCRITVDSVSTKINPKKVQFSISNLDDENTQRSQHLDNSILVPILISRISTYLQLISVSKNRLACVTNSRVQF